MPKYCQCGKNKQALYNIFGNPPTYCGECRTDDMVNVKQKLCKCGEYASYGIIKNKSTHCGKCKSPVMKNIYHVDCYAENCNNDAVYMNNDNTRSCQEHLQGVPKNTPKGYCHFIENDMLCSKRASYGPIDFSDATYCSKHGKLFPNYESKQKNKCEECGLGTVEYGFSKATHCIDCFTEGMIVKRNLNRCQFDSCRTLASLSIDGIYPPTRCAEHTDGNIRYSLVGEKLCANCGERAQYRKSRALYYCNKCCTDDMERLEKTCVECDVLPTYGFIKDKKKTHCATHGTLLGMIDLKKHCEMVNCSAPVKCGYPFSIYTHCRSHKLPGQHDKKFKCLFSGCRETATHHFPDIDIPERCKLHANDNDILYTYKICDGCLTLIHNVNDDGLCHSCIKWYNDTKTADMTRLKKYLINSTYIKGTDSNYYPYPDIVIEQNNFNIVVKHTKDQHIKSNSICDRNRAVNLYTCLNKPIVYIFINSGDYTDENGIKYRSNIPTYERLVNTVNSLFKVNILPNPINIVYIGCNYSNIKKVSYPAEFDNRYGADLLETL